MDIKETNVQDQEVGVINFVKFSQGDTSCGYLMITIEHRTTRMLYHLVHQWYGWYMIAGKHRATLVRE